MKFIIDFKNDLTETEISDYLQSINCTSFRNFNLANKTYLVECPVEPTINADIHDHIINDDEHAIKLLSTTIVDFDQTWGTTQLDGPVVTISTTDNHDWWKNYVLKHPKFDEPSYQIERKGTGYVVYVMDSGCDLTHPEFVDRPVINLFSFNNDFTDTSGHGTALASVITGNTCGISNATVKVVKIFDKTQPTKQSDMINALDSIYQDFIANNYVNAVINCSWTISKNTFLESKLQILHEMGLVIVAAAGNSGVPIENVTPASMPMAVTVGSYNSDLRPCDFSNYSNSMISVTNNITNYGELDGWAPGEDIYAAILSNQYGNIAGTSVSAAIQSAVITYNLTTYSLTATLVPHNQYVSQVSFSRYGILDLSDSKYNNSKNAITTLHSEVQRMSDDVYTSASLAVSGTNFATRICDPRAYKRVEIYGDLPSGTQVYDNGMFGGKSTEVDSVEVISVPMKLINNVDMEFPFVFKIVTTPSTWDIGDGTNDPELDILLQSGSCILRECNDGGCFNNCGGAQCIPYQDKSCPALVYERCECNF